MLVCACSGSQHGTRAFTRHHAEPPRARVMFSPLPVSAAPGSAQPLTLEPDLNDFCVQVQLSNEVMQTLKTLPADKARLVLSILRSKMAQKQLASPSHYLAGIIRNELNHGHSFSQSSWTAPGAAAAAAAPAGPQVTPAVLQTVASPMGQRGCKRPAWVTEAWTLATKPSQLMRKMMGVVGPKSMMQLSELPPNIQLSVLLALVHNEAAWQDPAAALAKSVATITGLPRLCTPSAVLQGRQRRGLVAIQMGMSYGAEWPHFQFATEELRKEFPDLYVMARHAFMPQMLHTDVLASTSQGVVLHSCTETFLEVVRDAAREWRAAEAMIAIFINLPVGNNNTSGDSPHPGYHVGASAALWDYISVLKALGAVSDARLVYIVMDRAAVVDAKPAFLSEVFGGAFDVTPAMTRVPTATWRCRTFPVHSGELEPPTSDPSEVTRFHPTLRDFRSGVPSQAVMLPTVEQLEEYNDARTYGEQAVQCPENYELLTMAMPGTGGSASTARLLNRQELSTLWGISGWKFDAVFDRLVPCTRRCDPFSGFPLPEGQGVACGQDRYCMHCDGWYRTLFDCPPPHAWSMMTQLLGRSLRAKHTEEHAWPWNGVPDHDCDGTGCGCW